MKPREFWLCKNLIFSSPEIAKSIDPDTIHVREVLPASTDSDARLAQLEEFVNWLESGYGGMFGRPGKDEATDAYDLIYEQLVELRTIRMPSSKTDSDALVLSEAEKKFIIDMRKIKLDDNKPLATMKPSFALKLTEMPVSGTTKDAKSLEPETVINERAELNAKIAELRNLLKLADDDRHELHSKFSRQCRINAKCPKCGESK